MAQTHGRFAPNGAGSPPVQEQILTDTISGVLWLDDRAGLAVISAACKLMKYKMQTRSYIIRRAPSFMLSRMRQNPRFRAHESRQAAA